MTPLHTSHPIVLGSGSPRRKEILSSLGIAHVVVTAEVDERPLAEERAADYLARIVNAKLAAVRRVLPAELAQRAPVVLVADTTVIDRTREGQEAILGKPSDARETRAMLCRLSGRVHEVWTRFAIGSATSGEPPLHVETVTTRVTFRTLSAGEIDAYAESGEGLDKAGGYAVQGLASAFVPRIEGSYSNVVGLPACEVAVALSRLGLRG